MTAQLLSFSRIHGLEPQAVDLNEKIEGMIELLGVTLGFSSDRLGTRCRHQGYLCRFPLAILSAHGEYHIDLGKGPVGLDGIDGRAF